MAFFLSTTSPEPQDDELRRLAKELQLLVASKGNQALAFFPEGSMPEPGDTKERLLIKINKLRGAP